MLYWDQLDTASATAFGEGDDDAAPFRGGSQRICRIYSALRKQAKGFGILVICRRKHDSRVAMTLLCVWYIDYEPTKATG
jgi:hypothetical protein